LHAKIDKRKKQIHQAHNIRFKPNDRLEAVIRSTIRDLEKRKDKAMDRSDTDDFWIKIESLQWVLFVIFAITNGRMIVIPV